METVKIKGKHAHIIAHRGANSLERENTAPAFLVAANKSYYGIETDIQVLADGSFVAMHDDTPERVSLGASCVRMADCTYADIKDIILPDLDGSFVRTDIRIPTLADYVKICKKYKKKCILELKNAFKKEDVARLIEEIRALDYLKNVIFISIEYENCVHLRELLPNAPVQYLTGQRMNNTILHMLTSMNLDAGIDIDYKKPQRNKERIDLLHSRGIKVNVCVCDDPILARELLDMGADYLTTNCLE